MIKKSQVIQEHWNTYDVIVLAQASMANAIQYITQGREIVTSLPLGVAAGDIVGKARSLYGVYK